MKKWQKLSLILLTFSLSMGWITQGDAALIRIGAPGVVVTQAQPIPVTIIDSNGNTFQQTAYYNPAVGGIDIDTSWAGPNASIYIPTLGVSYIWYNGYWVDQEGYYWNGTRRVYVSDPRWKEHWTTYWHEHRHGGGDHWHEGRGEWHGQGQNWHEKTGEWRDERRQDWREGRGERQERTQDWRDRRNDRRDRNEGSPRKQDDRGPRGGK